jgi:hypothetical protein
LKWQYLLLKYSKDGAFVNGSKAEFIPRLLHDALNQLGSEGWELVHVGDHDPGSGVSETYYLKRPLVK